MGEMYVECLVKGRKNSKALALRTVFIIATIIFVVTAILYTPYLFILVVFSAFGIYMSNQYVNVEYEYLYLDKELTIDVIYNQNKRKKIATYLIERMEVFAPIKSYHLDNFGKVDPKAKDYSIGYEDQPDLRYVMFFEGREQIILSPNEELIKAMKLTAPRKVFTD